jgi:hypothetical protein
MNPLDFLNSFLDTVHYGVKGVHQESSDALNNYLVAKRQEADDAALEEYRRKRKEMFLRSPNEQVRLNAQYPTYGLSPREAVEKIAGHWGVRNPTLPDYVRDFPPEVQRVAQTFADLPPEIPDHIKRARSNPNYKKWLASSKNFSLGGRQYRWEEAPVGNIPEKLLSIPQTKSRNYSSLLSDLTNRKRWETGNSKYIPVLVEPFK